MNTPEWLEAIKQRLKDIPHGLRSDWEHTNHYELTKPDGDWLWFAMDDIAPNFNHSTYHPDTEGGKRLGYMFDAAAAVPALLQLVEKQREALEFYAKQEHMAGEYGENDPNYEFIGVSTGGYPMHVERGCVATEALLFKPEGVEA